MFPWSPYDARVLATSLLISLPGRLAHSLRAGIQARQLTGAVPPDDADLLVCAALLHDIGYAPALQQTGFHPLDGATYLVSVGAPNRLAALVAHHSEARMLAEPAGLLGALSRFPREDGAVSDALAYADLTASPSGALIDVSDRLEDIARRHRNDDPVLVAARLARVPRLLAAVERVRRRLPVPAGTDSSVPAAG
jgi:hypothetical protein